MKTRLSRISRRDFGLFSAFVGFALSIPFLVFAFISSGPGRTVTLSGFLSLTFTGGLPLWALVYPFLNALAGFISGFLGAWLYNFYARLFGGVSFDLEQ